MSQIREEVSFTKGRIIVRGKLVSRGKAKRADYVLYYKPNIPLALIEAKDNTCAAGRCADADDSRTGARGRIRMKVRIWCASCFWPRFFGGRKGVLALASLY
jgi:hypothetical protein